LRACTTFEDTARDQEPIGPFSFAHSESTLLIRAREATCRTLLNNILLRLNSGVPPK
jgi:hypothetical protein